MYFRRLWIGFAFLGLGACATVQDKPPYFPTPVDEVVEPALEDIEEWVVAEPLEDLPPSPIIPAPRTDIPDPPEEPVIEQPLWFDSLVGWEAADHRPALKAFRQSCETWSKADPDLFLNPNLPEYGVYKDWYPACESLPDKSGMTILDARKFIETEFSPLSLSTGEAEEGLLTGYYEPEIDVRIKADKVFYEPILAVPQREEVLSLPRSEINALSSRIIAYGRPIDVFFMQIQGSGRIKFKNGRVLRTAYAANNGKPYKSIGRALVARGEMKLEQASKQAIEKWMAENGPLKTRELMNENPRYIFFKEERINTGEGPRGATRIPLTAMGSAAIDPRYHPYGTLAWLETRLPQSGRDYKGKPSGLLVSLQDTGSAIKGPLRGDLFFGSGEKAGAKAGVMKHPVRWTILVPKAIAPNVNQIS